ncbi:MAG: hypothetical protein ACRDY7_14325 [Acidimicrobiia bacterium]
MRIRPLLVVAIVLSAVVAPARPAAAVCECPAFDARRALAEAPAAFVGFLVSRDTIVPPGEEPLAEGEEIFRFQVQEPVKGDFSESNIVPVRSQNSPDSCGLLVEGADDESDDADRAVGLILSQDENGNWHGSLCRQMEPERLLRAAQELPTPDGAPPPDLLLAGSYGVGRAVSLEFDGKLVSYGPGSGRTTATSVCKGGSHAAELFTTTGPDGVVTPGVAVRRLADMVVAYERTLPQWAANPAGPPEANGSVDAIACRDASGADIVMAARRGPDAGGRAQLLRLARPPGSTPDPTLVIVWEGAAYRSAAFGPAGATAYFGRFPNGEELVAVDIPADGTTAPPAPRPVARIPAGSGPVVASPDGLRLAAVAALPSSSRSQVVLVDLSTDPPTLRQTPFVAAGGGATGDLSWSTQNRLVFAPRLNPREPVRLFDERLRVLAEWAGWTAERSVASGDRLFGAGTDADQTTKLYAAPLATGPATVIRELDDALVHDMTAVAVPTATSARSDPAGPPGVPVTTTTAPATTPTTGRSADPDPRQPSTTTTTAAATPEPRPSPAAPSGPRSRPRPDRPGTTSTTTSEVAAPIAPGTRDTIGEAAPAPVPGDGDGGSGWAWPAALAVLVAGGAAAAVAVGRRRRGSPAEGA